MAAKEMTVRACRDGGFVVYDRIQMVQNPDPIAAFGEIRAALGFVLKAMLPAETAPAGLQEQHLREVEKFLVEPLSNPPFYVGADSRLGPRDEPLMEDDRS